MAQARASRLKRRRFSSSFRSSKALAARAWKSFGATRYPVWPSTTPSSTPSAPTATTGTPMAWASQITSPWVSVSLAKRKSSAIR